MREIKFRAWDRVDKKMICPVEKETSWDLLNKFGDRVMQYIWAKDKNWKEIYEGDEHKF